MKKKKLIKQVAKWAVRQGCEIKLEAKEFDTKERKLLGEATTKDTGVELHVWHPEGKANE